MTGTDTGKAGADTGKAGATAGASGGYWKVLYRTGPAATRRRPWELSTRFASKQAAERALDELAAVGFVPVGVAFRVPRPRVPGWRSKHGD